MKLLAVCFLIALALVACSQTLPVRGQLQESSETFQGSATGYVGGYGDLQVRSSRGTVCKGEFVYETERFGRGVVNCDDGRSGPFQFSSTGSYGNGWGDLGSDRFIFTFGH